MRIKKIHVKQNDQLLLILEGHYHLHGVIDPQMVQVSHSATWVFRCLFLDVP